MTKIVNVRASKRAKAHKRRITITNRQRDKKRIALNPGKRISKNGKTYYEYRKNRSDLNRRIGL